MRRLPLARTRRDTAAFVFLVAAATGVANAQDSAPQSRPAATRVLAMTSPPPNQTAPSAVREMTGPPVMAVVSIKDQRISLYDANGGAMRAKISSGSSGNETPVGTYSILQKNRDHYSNVYNSIPMPFMQRLTWSGLALHHGALPGYPASHGCVRLPYDYSQQIFERTKIGMRVVVTRDNIAPVEIQHPTLLQPGPLKNRLAVTKIAFGASELGDRSTSIFQADIRNNPGRLAELNALKAVADTKITEAELAKEPVESLSSEIAIKSKARAPAEKLLKAAIKDYKSANDTAARANRDYAAAKDPEKIRAAEREKSSADTASVNAISELASAKAATKAAKANGRAPAERLVKAATNANKAARDKAARATRDLAALYTRIKRAEIEKDNAEKALLNAALELEKAEAPSTATTDKERAAQDKRLNVAKKALKLGNDRSARADREMAAAHDAAKIEKAERDKASAEVAVINTESVLASAKVTYKKAISDAVISKLERAESNAARTKDQAVGRAQRAAKALAFALEPARYTKEEALASKAKAGLDAAKAAKDKAQAALAEINAELAELDQELTTATIHRNAAVVAAQAAQLKTYPVSLFVSRKTQRVYLRQGHQPIIDMPIDIVKPDRPIGTHVFTAVDYENEGANLRWTAVSMARRPASDLEKFANRPNPKRGEAPEPYPTNIAIASAALDRVILPPQMMDIVSKSAWPGSSLIVSDEEAHKETDTATDFIVVISGEPQGGIIKSKKPEKEAAKKEKPRRSNVYIPSAQPNYGYGSNYTDRYMR